MNNFRIPAPLSLTGNVSENFRKFKQGFEIYVKAQDFENKKPEVKVAILLNIIGEDAVELFNTFDLSSEDEQKYESVLKAFEDYCIPKKNIVVERFKFNSRIQFEGESFDSFFTDLKKLVKSCEYNEQTDSVLRDRIVLGIYDKSQQESLLRIKDLNLEKTVEFCKTAELSRQQAEYLQNDKVLSVLHNVNKNISGFHKEPIQRDNIVKQSTKMKSDKNKPILNSYRCKKCNTVHAYAKCPAYGKKCNNCGKLNHFAVGCKFRKVRSVFDGNSSIDEKQGSNLSNDFVINKLNDVTNNSSSKVKEWCVTLNVENNQINFKLDTGAQVNVLPLHTFKQLKSKSVVHPSTLVLEAFGGSKIQAVGSVKLGCKQVDSEGNESTIDFVLIDNNKAIPLLGLSGCLQLNLINRVNIMNCSSISSKEAFLKSYKDVFEGTGTFKDECDIIIPDGVRPIVKPPRRVPLSLRERLKAKLNHLVKEEIISEVDSPKSWVSNLVIIEKPDGSLRLCLDPTELNKVIQRQYHLIPTMEDITAKLCGKAVFSVLDLKDGFYQVPLNKKSREYCSFSTPFGCYQFNRLPFGLANAPELFQKINERNFGDIKGVSVYFDDILVAGKNKEEHDEILSNVLDRARLLNVKFNSTKLQYRVDEVTYLGHIFNKEGIKPDPNMVRAIIALKDPINKTELQRILGMINYLRRFVPDMPSLTSNLRELLKKNVDWKWTGLHSEELQRIKRLISSAPVLGVFDPNGKIAIQCDSSKDGTGCCLMCDDRPVAFASRSLTEAEKNYSQIEKELLSIVFATQKFHYFIYGHKVLVQTDHKPLVTILLKNVADIPSSRLQRMKIKLLKYNLRITYLPGKLMYVADLLSRSYIQDSVEDDQELTEIVHMLSKNLQMTEERKSVFRKQTEADPILFQIMNYCQEVWPKSIKEVPDRLKFYFKLRTELCVEDGIVFLNNKVVVPSSLRKEMLQLLHESHFGMEKTKARARQVLYWPGINRDIENLISQCSVCENFRPANCKEPLISHDIPELPFSKVAADICDYGGSSFLILACYFSKWLEIMPLKDKTAEEVCSKLKPVFSNHGIPKLFMSDNMPFSSFKFKEFAKNWGIDLITSSPKYPKSNGFAERMVGIAKNIIKKCSITHQDIHLALLEYRNTPIAGMHASPAQLLMNRQLRSKLPITEAALRPVLQEGVR